MVKKIVVFLCFFAGATCFISAGLYINRQNAGLEPQKTEETVSKVKSPELLSEIDMTSYVSLPESFSDIDITEDLRLRLSFAAQIGNESGRAGGVSR